MIIMSLLIYNVRSASNYNNLLSKKYFFYYNYNFGIFSRFSNDFIFVRNSWNEINFRFWGPRGKEGKNSFRNWIGLIFSNYSIC